MEVINLVTSIFFGCNWSKSRFKKQQINTIVRLAFDKSFSLQASYLPLIYFIHR